MPYIELKTTAAVSENKAENLKAAFGKAIECFPGKTEKCGSKVTTARIAQWFPLTFSAVFPLPLRKK